MCGVAASRAMLTVAAQFTTVDDGDVYEGLPLSA